jgi:lysozyme
MAKGLPPLVLAALGAGALLLLAKRSEAAPARGDSGDPDAPGPQPSSTWNASVNTGNLDAWLPDQLSPSPELVAWLKGREGFLATKTYLGDGGATIGYGHYEPSGPKADALPATITQAEAEALLMQDIQVRAVANVQRYINIPLLQNQYDALVSLAFNLSPAAFAHIADAVNAGDGLDPVIFNYVRAGSAFEAGLTARRNAELAMFDSASYA